jgi:hypothetical protein
VVQKRSNFLFRCTIFSKFFVASYDLEGDGCPFNLVRIQVLKLVLISERLGVWTNELLKTQFHLSHVTIFSKILLLTHTEFRNVRDAVGVDGLYDAQLELDVLP